MSQFAVTFLGVRGTTPCCGNEYQKYGGHTSCILMDVGNDVLIFDAGSGIANLDQYLKNKDQQNIHLFFSHVHLDHILGLPAFKALWDANKNINIYAGTLQPYGGIKHFLQKFFSPPLLPICFQDFSANIRCKDFTPGDVLQLESGLNINTCALNHPNGAVGYRVNYQGKSVCYVTDTEHTLGEIDQNISNLISETDLFIYDSTFTDDNYVKHHGWGHSTWQEGCRLSQDSNVKQTAIFHHDPRHNDAQMDAIEKAASTISPHIFIAKQGQCVNLL